MGYIQTAGDIGGVSFSAGTADYSHGDAGDVMAGFF
jgi:hypothetical protein